MLEIDLIAYNGHVISCDDRYTDKTAILVHNGIFVDILNDIDPENISAKQIIDLEGKTIIPGLFDGEHIFTVEPLPDERVRFIQREVMAGILVPLFFRGMDKTTRRGFEEMNQVFKSMAERTSSK